MKREDRCGSSDVSLKKVVSLLPTDYGNLTNIPTINGVSILGDLTNEELNILSSTSSEYDTVVLSNIEDTSSKYLILLGEDGEDVQKLALDDLLTEAQITVTESVNESASVGSVQFVSYN